MGVFATDGENRYPQMALTNIEIKNAKFDGKVKKLADGRGLYLLVNKAGKYWRFKYRFGGKEKLLALGVYPDVGLADARSKLDEARKLVAAGVDPAEHRRGLRREADERACNSFEAVAMHWFEKNKESWVGDHAEKIVRALHRDIFPKIGATPVSELTAKNVLEAVRLIEARGAIETARRALQYCGRVMRFAVAEGKAKHDVTADLKGALKAVKEKHFAAVTEPEQLAGLLRMINGYEGSKVVSCALRLAPLVFVRPGELRTAKWADIDLDAAEWRYWVSKTDTQHIVPLSRQALAILREIQPFTGSGVYVFPGARTNGRPMSDNAILAAMRRLGIGKDEMTGHGFRAAARTILDEVLGVRPDFIEHQLAHAVRDANGRAYNRTTHLKQRREMMQRWADYLDELAGVAGGKDED